MWREPRMASECGWKPSRMLEREIGLCLRCGDRVYQGVGYMLPNFCGTKVACRVCWIWEHREKCGCSNEEEFQAWFVAEALEKMADA